MKIMSISIIGLVSNIDVSPSRVIKIVNGARGASVGTAMRLASFLG